MKTRMSFLILVLLLLPLVLAACGGGPTGEAKAYLEAVADGDKDEAEKHVCDKNKELLTTGIGDDTKAEIKSIDCEEKDDDKVECKVETEEDGEDTITFKMEDGKVCEPDFGE
jgi:hypothetical protein